MISISYHFTTIQRTLLISFHASFTITQGSHISKIWNVSSQKAVICELEGQLSEERNLRREERDKAAQDLKSALHKVQAEAQEEIKRQAQSYLRQQNEQKDVINKLQVLPFSNFSLIWRPCLLHQILQLPSTSASRNQKKKPVCLWKHWGPSWYGIS